MKWTNGKIETVRALALSGSTMREVAAKLGVGISSISGVAYKNRIKFGHPRSFPHPESEQFIDAINSVMCAEDAVIRSHWAAEMPRLRERVRAEVAAIMAEAR